MATGFMYFISATDVAIILGPSADVYFMNISLLIKTNGVNGSNNNTFIDSSTNNYTITKFGNTGQGAFSPFSNSWSVNFNGSGTYLNTPSSTINILTGDYTIEAWVYPLVAPTGNSISTSLPIIVGMDGGSIWHTWCIGSSGYLIIDNAGNSYMTIPGSIPTIGIWSHLAFVKSGTTLKVYLNGFLVATQLSLSGSWNTGSSIMSIGGTNGFAAVFNGYISNLRIVNGTALYITDFTPSTTPLTAITNTTFLGCQTNRFKDSSTNNVTITPVGAPSTQQFNPFIPSSTYSTTVDGGSMVFDGNTDYLSAPSVTITGNFTIEGWFYNTGTINGHSFFGIGGDDTGIVLRTFSGNAYGYIVGSGGYWASVPLNPYINTWHHIAITRNGSSITLWFNGVSQGVSNNASTISGQIGIGKSATGTNFGSFAGYISDFRVINGTALYTTNFTPPTTPLTTITNTRVLLNGTNAAIYDTTGINDIRTLGNVVVNTTTKKFSSSMFFDGNNGSYLSMPHMSFNFGSSKFTVEFWINSTGSGFTNQMIYTRQPTSTGYSPVAIGKFGSTLNLWLSSTGNSWDVNGVVITGALTTNIWHHIAIVRNGNTITAYLDGVNTYTTSYSNTLYSSSNSTIIGGETDNGYAFNGYIEDFRIINGIARYTADFAPPTQAFAS